MYIQYIASKSSQQAFRMSTCALMIHEWMLVAWISAIWAASNRMCAHDRQAMRSKRVQVFFACSKTHRHTHHGQVHVAAVFIDEANQGVGDDGCFRNTLDMTLKTQACSCDTMCVLCCSHNFVQHITIENIIYDKHDNLMQWGLHPHVLWYLLIQFKHVWHVVNATLTVRTQHCCRQQRRRADGEWSMQERYCMHAVSTPLFHVQPWTWRKRACCPACMLYCVIQSLNNMFTIWKDEPSIYLSIYEKMNLLSIYLSIYLYIFFYI